ncbi:caspase, EACC1-associated type [Actinacidiphila sp. bgisy167]|uniref:caspase, EACC1-associated type n=1 Tax=Actinacidiphila sp. bgisy167 TaxID=3413797 RepID=UPI003D70F192
MPYEPFASRSRAVLIGVSQYEHARDFSNIPSARANVTRLRAALVSGGLGRFIPRTVETLAEPRTRDRALRLIALAAAQAQDLLLVYFTGHGYVDLTSGRPELYLMTRESTKNGARLDGIPYRDLLKLLASSRAERVVLVLDCCYSGNAGLVPLPERPFSLITSSAVGSRIHKGDGIDPTPFTGALVRVLTEGTDPYDPVTVQSLGVRLHELAGEYAAALDESVDYDPWFPTERSSNSSGDTVLSQARLTPRPARGARWLAPLRRLAQYAGFSWTWTAGPHQPLWHRAVGLGTGLALLAGGVTAWTYAHRPPPLCPAPLELRVLTAPETRAALSSVLDAFQDSEADGATASLGGRPEGCGQINTTVYAAPTDRAVAAFRSSAAWAEPERACAGGAEDGGSTDGGDGEDREDCAMPLRDVGPHPDVWIPAAGTAVTRVLAETRRPESVVALGRPVTLAHSPAVVATTTSLDGVERTGSTVQQLVDAAHAQDVVVRSAEPHSSDAALHQLLHLRPGTRVTTDAVPPADDRALACSARTWLVERGGTQQALLTAESTLAGLVTPTLESRPPCLGNQSDPYTAYYPSDVPPLRLTFVPVTWETGRADRADRAEAVRRLGAWLGSRPGQRALAAQGFRTDVSGTEEADDTPLDSAVFVADPRAGGRPPTREDIEDALRAGGEAAGTRRDVLFAVDVSSSSHSRANIPLVRSVLARASGYRYGIAAVPGRTLLDIGAHDAAARDAAIRELASVERDAPVAAALRQWSRALADSPGALIVLITDDEDSAGEEPPDTDVPVLVVSLEAYGCSLHFNKAVTENGGACLAITRDLPNRVAETIDRLTTGGS